MKAPRILIAILMIAMLVSSLSAQKLNWNAGMRSLLIPGQGQRYNGERAEGNLISGVAVLSAVTAIVSHRMALRYDEKMFDASLPDYYFDTPGYHYGSIRTISSSVLVTTWGMSVFDALYTERRPTNSSVQKLNWSAGLRSLLIPGQGQRHNEQNYTGNFFSGITVLCGTIVILSHRKVLDNDLVYTVSSRKLFMVWGLNVIDALLIGGKSQNLKMGFDNESVMIAFSF